MKNLKEMIFIIFLLILLIYVTDIDSIPNTLILFKEEPINLNTVWGISIDYENQILQADVALKNEGVIEKKEVNLKLFNAINVKKIEVNTIPRTTVIPLGNSVGLKLYTSGVLVVGMTEVKGEKPYQDTGIEEGDMIIKINEEEITSTQELVKEVNNSCGNTLEVKYVRNGKEYITTVKPIKTKENEYKLGLWVRDGAAGIGTITYYEPSTKKFAALGHGIVDIDTEELISISSGELVTARVSSIVKGKNGMPGEIKGSIANRKNNRKCWPKYRIWYIWKFN